jgi:hypothetical protein
MKQAIAGTLASITNTEVASKLNAVSSATQKSGALSMPGGSASSAVNSNVSSEVTNATKTAIENIYQQNLKNNFNSETVNECIGKTTQNNSANAENMKVGGEFIAECIQTNTLEQVQHCKQLATAANKALQQTAQELGFKVTTEDETIQKNEIKEEGGASSENTGLIQDLGGAIDKLLGLGSLGIVTPFAGICCLLCCCILLGCLSSMMASRSSSTTVVASQPVSTGGYSDSFTLFSESSSLFD